MNTQPPGQGPWGDPSQWHMPPPGAGDRPPEPPQPVRSAVNLMYAGAVLGVFSLVSVFAQTDEIREQIEEDNTRLTESEIDTAVSAGIGFAVILSLVVIGLWIWMAVMNKQGRNWARITGTVFGAVNIGFTALGLVFGATLGTADTGLSTVLGIASAALAGVILVFLWQPESTRYYEQMGHWGPSRY